MTVMDTGKVDVLLGLQWGDEGKGKVVDVLTPGYDVIARFQGGPNAGHTLEFGGGAPEPADFVAVFAQKFRDGLGGILLAARPRIIVVNIQDFHRLGSL